jgi:hypothetical protein
MSLADLCVLTWNLSHHRDISLTSLAWTVLDGQKGIVTGGGETVYLPLASSPCYGRPLNTIAYII